MSETRSTTHTTNKEETVNVNINVSAPVESLPKNTAGLLHKIVWSKNPSEEISNVKSIYYSEVFTTWLDAKCSWLIFKEKRLDIERQIIQHTSVYDPANIEGVTGVLRMPNPCDNAEKTHYKIQDFLGAFKK